MVYCHTPRPTMASPTSAMMTPIRRRRRRGFSEASGRWWSGSVRGGAGGGAGWVRGGAGWLGGEAGMGGIPERCL